MLGKLLKYEFKATERIFSLMYVALLALAVVNAFVLPFDGWSWEEGFLSGLLSSIVSLLGVLYALTVAGVLVVTIIIIIVRFYRMLGDEGYLQFTLPVTANQQLLAKLITAVVWFIASCVVVVASLAILSLRAGVFEDVMSAIANAWDVLVLLGLNPGLWVICATVLLAVSVLASTLMFYAAMSVGPNFTKSRLGGSVLAYMIGYFISQFVSLAALFGLAATMGDRFSGLNEITDTDALLVAAPQIVALLDQTVLQCSGVYIAVYLVFAVVLYFVARYFMDKKLNLA